MIVFESVLKSLIKRYVQTRWNVPTTEMDAVTLSIKIRVATSFSVRLPMPKYYQVDSNVSPVDHVCLKNSSVV